jgi:hypothetical protein
MGTKKKPGWFELSAGCIFLALIYRMKNLRSICNGAKNSSMPNAGLKAYLKNHFSRGFTSLISI